MSHYHKEIKNQWARDDPAFVVLLVAALCGASLLYAIAFHCASVSEYLTMFFRMWHLTSFRCSLCVKLLSTLCLRFDRI
jgi:hypothetical protein